MLDPEIARQYEQYFSVERDRSFELLEGARKIMLSAPHSVAQTRDGKLKTAEPQTGMLVKLLHDELACPAIYKTKNCGDDANFDEESAYKRALQRYIRTHGVRFLIDLHQLSPDREVQIDIGTGKSKNLAGQDCVNAALKAFTRRNLGVVQLGKPFDAAEPYTISSFIAATCKIPCVQIEINSALVCEGYENYRLGDVYEALKEFILAVEAIG